VKAGYSGRDRGVKLDCYSGGGIDSDSCQGSYSGLAENTVSSTDPI
jgi:hypothetical protein